MTLHWFPSTFSRKKKLKAYDTTLISLNCFFKKKLKAYNTTMIASNFFGFFLFLGLFSFLFFLHFVFAVLFGFFAAAAFSQFFGGLTSEARLFASSLDITWGVARRKNKGESNEGNLGKF